MPKLGEIIIIKEQSYCKFIWLACQKCGSERWVPLSRISSPKFTNLCWRCWRTKPKGTYPKGANSPNWKGQPRIKEHGYVAVPVDYDNPFRSMADNKGEVYEHRLIMAQYLGRCLNGDEIVHHRNGIKVDNRIENLELLPSHYAHGKLHMAIRRKASG